MDGKSLCGRRERGRVRGGRKDEDEEEGEGREEERKKHRKWRRRYMKCTALSRKYPLA